MSDSSRASQRSRSTLQDVAEMAGVSATTVSLVLSGKAINRRISEDTHRRVYGAATALGYTPSLLHRSMRRGRTYVISLYNSFRNREWSDLYMDRLSAAVEHAGGSFGYDVLVHCNFRRDTKETYEFLNGGFSDGLILFGPGADEPLLPLLRASNLPTVLIGPRVEEPVLTSVCDDEDEGMRLVAEALVERGHTRVAAIVEKPSSVLDPTGRLPRLKSELAARGVELSDSDVVLWKGSAPDALAEVLALESRPTALFVWHDRAAYRIVESCEAAGIRVPQDLSIVAYDGLVWPATTSHVVASVVVALDEVGQVAVNLLDRMIEGNPVPLTEKVPVAFNPGSTLGAPAS
jgi:LacI family transcriptional regulator